MAEEIDYKTNERAAGIRKEAAEIMRREVDRGLLRGEELPECIENAREVVKKSCEFWRSEFGLGVAGLDGITDYLIEIEGEWLK